MRALFQRHRVVEISSVGPVDGEDRDVENERRPAQASGDVVPESGRLAFRLVGNTSAMPCLRSKIEVRRGSSRRPRISKACRRARFRPTASG